MGGRNCTIWLRLSRGVIVTRSKGGICGRFPIETKTEQSEVSARPTSLRSPLADLDDPTRLQRHVSIPTMRLREVRSLDVNLNVERNRAKSGLEYSDRLACRDLVLQLFLGLEIRTDVCHADLHAEHCNTELDN